MVGLIEGFRSVFAKGASPDLDLLAVSALTVAAVFALSWLVYRRMSRYFADVL
jgi:lipopolysaccharide transport system permease protein